MNNVAVIIPCYKVKDHILKVLKLIGDEVHLIVVVDDACPEASGNYVIENNTDKRVNVIFHDKNSGVGGATLTGYDFAARHGADILVKLDGDGQMNPSLIPRFIWPIQNGIADYSKGNRFYNVEDVKSMPIMRLIGNAVLSFTTKLASGLWHIFDPTNGYTAICTLVYLELPVHKIHRRYFFESDMLFRIGLARAKVIDIPMKAVYADEKSSLSISKVFLDFFVGNLRNCFKRIAYNYFLRDFSVASLELILGITFFFYGISFGFYSWHESLVTGIVASNGTVMLAALPVILGIQFMLSFLAYDMNSHPKDVVHKVLHK